MVVVHTLDILCCILFFIDQQRTQGGKKPLEDVSEILYCDIMKKEKVLVERSYIQLCELARWWPEFVALSNTSLVLYKRCYIVLTSPGWRAEFGLPCLGPKLDSIEVTALFSGVKAGHENMSSVIPSCYYCLDICMTD